MTGRERVLAMLSGKTPDSLPLMPITMMFAADQVGVHYRDYATDYRVLVEAQIHTAEQFDFDHVSCISDPGREAADCGASVIYFDDQPPAIDELHARLANKADLLTLKMPDPLGGGRMHDRVLAAALFKQRVGGVKLIEGWVEGPCAEGADLRGINTLMMDFYDDPAFIHDLFAFNVEMALAFARAQVDAGADIVGVGDAAASLIGPHLYEEFVFPHEKRLVDGLHAMGTRVRLHICGDTSAILTGMGRLACDIVDLDYLASLAEARTAMGPEQVLLGNMDPVSALRNSTVAAVTDTVTQCHREAGPHYIVGAGCEIPRGTPLENVQCLREYARTH